MAERLYKEYEKAKALGGIKAQMRLAILTRITETAARTLPDSPENIALFEAAMGKLSKEFQSQGKSP